MNQRALALSLRALRESTRSKWPILVRGLLIGLLFFSVTLAQQMSLFSANVNSGPYLLAWLAWSNWALITLLGVGTFSAVITEEKELMTLGLLRLAGFTPVSLLLGKSVGLLLQTLLLIIVQIPFCMLAITLGGVTMQQIVGVYSLLLAYTLFVYCLALLCSVLKARNSGAASLTGLLLALYHLLPLVGHGLISQAFDWGGGQQVPDDSFAADLVEFFQAWSASTAFSGLAQTTTLIGGIGLALTTQVVVNTGLALALFILAWVLFDRCNRNEVPAAPDRGFVLARLFGARSATYRVGSNPFTWKEYRFLVGGHLGLLLRVLLYTVLFSILAVINPNMSAKNFGEMMMGLMCCAVVLEAAVQLGRVLQQEVKNRTLASLFALPHSLGSIVWSKVLGSLWICLPSLGFLLLGALLAPRSALDAVEDLLSEGGAWLVLAEICFGLHLTVYYSLRLRRAAVVSAIATVLFGNILAGMLLAAASPGYSFLEAVMALAALVLVGGCFLLQVAIAARIRQLVAEG